MRKFCEPIILSPEERKQFTFPRIEFNFNCQGDLYTYIDGELKGIDRKHLQKVQKKPLI
jgi:hypothetical protein